MSINQHEKTPETGRLESTQRIINTPEVEKAIQEYRDHLAMLGASAFQEDIRNALMRLSASLQGEFTPEAKALFEKFIAENNLNKMDLWRELDLDEKEAT